MTDTFTLQLTHLLQDASAAHGVYETDVLDGVYDEQWAAWYADWLVNHGLNELLETHFDAPSFGKLLEALNVEHEQSERSESWAQFTARALIARYR